MKNEFIYPMRIQVEDTDYTGLVYHSKYLNFMERARSEWIEELGVGLAWLEEQKIYFVMHAIQIDFIKPAHLHEKIEVVSVVKSMRSASIVFDHCLRSTEPKDKLLAKAEVKVVCVNRDYQPCKIPQNAIFDTFRRTLS